MKSAIHPQYYPDCQVTCACGNKFVTGSTQPKVDVEICAKCHPFFTGQQKFVDIKGRIDKFKEKVTRGASYKATKAKRVADKKAKKAKDKS